MSCKLLKNFQWFLWVVCQNRAKLKSQVYSNMFHHKIAREHWKKRVQKTEGIFVWMHVIKWSYISPRMINWLINKIVCDASHHAQQYLWAIVHHEAPPSGGGEIYMRFKIKFFICNMSTQILVNHWVRIFYMFLSLNINYSIFVRSLSINLFYMWLIPKHQLIPYVFNSSTFLWKSKIQISSIKHSNPKVNPNMKQYIFEYQKNRI